MKPIVNEKAIEKLMDDVRAIKEALLGCEMRPEGALLRLKGVEKRINYIEKLIDRSRYLILAFALFSLDDIYDSVRRLIQLF